MPKFWDPRFTTAYNAAQDAEAGFLDNNPTVREVTMGAGMTVYDEPMQSIGPLELPEDMAAGMTLQAYLTTVQSGIDAAKVWKHTSTYMAFNPRVVGSRDIAGDMMDYFRKTLGPDAAVVGNDSIRATTDPNSAFYKSITTHGPPIGFQTAAPARIGNVLTTLGIAVQMHAEAVEIGKVNSAALTPSDFSNFDSQLLANAPA
jgi:hypothetical protein